MGRYLKVNGGPTTGRSPTLAHIGGLPSVPSMAAAIGNHPQEQWTPGPSPYGAVSYPDLRSAAEQNKDQRMTFCLVFFLLTCSANSYRLRAKELNTKTSKRSKLSLTPFRPAIFIKVLEEQELQLLNSNDGLRHHEGVSF